MRLHSVADYVRAANALLAIGLICYMAILPWSTRARQTLRAGLALYGFATVYSSWTLLGTSALARPLITFASVSVSLAGGYLSNREERARVAAAKRTAAAFPRRIPSPRR